MLFKAAKVSIGDEVVDRPSNNVMIFDIEDELRDICRICMRTGQLINPCACQARYHQRCMLLYIRKVLLRSLAVAAQVNVTTVKCRMCNHQLRFLYYSRTLADCGRAR